MTDAGQLPGSFQANIHRFYHRVVVFALSQLSAHDELAIGEAPKMGEPRWRGKRNADAYYSCS